MKRLLRLRRDESGMTYVFVGMSMMALLSASMLAIDVGMLMTARNQAQNSADAGALAGATALVFDDWNNRSATGPSVTNALNAARANDVMYGDVQVAPADVKFLKDGTGQSNRVQVTVRRAGGGEGGGVATFIAKFFGRDRVDVGAVATAEASPANAMTCVKPFTIPDRWIEKQTPPWDPNDSFDVVDKQGKPLANPDVYVPATSLSYTGYNAVRDKGLLITLKASNDTKIAPSFYYPWAPPDSSGADDYRWNIANCNQTVMPFGSMLTPEPGNMVGPTVQGMDDLIARDPSAYWDTAKNRVVSSQNPSPRVIVIPLFDPDFYARGKQSGRTADIRATNYLGFFIEEMRGNEVVGRVTPVGGLRKGNGFGETPIMAFPKAIRLVQ